MDLLYVSQFYFNLLKSQLYARLAVSIDLHHRLIELMKNVILSIESDT